MEYLFLKRKKTTFTSERQKTLLFKAANRQWEEQFAGKHGNGKRVDCYIYKCILYHLEIKQVFLDAGLSLKKMSIMINTNQTYLSNVVNRYFDCNLRELLNAYRVEYAKELLRAGQSSIVSMPACCGFASKSAFYTAFKKVTGTSPLHYLSQEKRSQVLQTVNLNTKL